MVLEWIDVASLAIEVVVVLIIVVAVLYGTRRYLYRFFQGRHRAADDDTQHKHGLGRSLLLGLEILVGADVVRTVALEPTFASVAVLGLLVVICTFLSWPLAVEIEGRWPWQQQP